MSIIIFWILQMMALRSTSAQFGGGGGGPSAFGYDASSACSKPYARNGRARFEKLPCDFRRQNWCTVAGSAYPWHAVRRFVQENQGLMRRMYGDERHINILKAELEKNDIELEYEDRYQRYPEESRRFQYEDEYEDRQRSGSRESFEARSFTGGSLNEPTTDRTGKFTKSPIEQTRPNIRTSESTTVPNSSSSPSSSLPDDDKNPSSAATSATTMENVSLRTSTSGSTTFGSSDEELAESWTERIRPNSTRPEKVASTAPAVTLADIARIKNSSINEIPGQSERLKDHVVFDPIDISIVPLSSSSTSSPVVEETTLESGVTPDTSSSQFTIDRNGEAEFEEGFKEASSPIIDQVFAASEQQPQQQFRPRPEYKPMESKPMESSNLEGQLFQDVAAKDQQELPVLKLRGVNACPVKEEVVAPFWANNTRGEVLALLNLYPFEQYVHWEKCTHENKQMYCRDGCRCEQQYRLHRLLAYDPNNECRGIFSDWFKFPSCCVCRCYDLPVEFRVTSRSPRMQKLRLRPPGNGRG